MMHSWQDYLTPLVYLPFLPLQVLSLLLSFRFEGNLGGHKCFLFVVGGTRSETRRQERSRVHNERDKRSTQRRDKRRVKREKKEMLLEFFLGECFSCLHSFCFSIDKQSLPVTFIPFIPFPSCLVFPFSPVLNPSVFHRLLNWFRPLLLLLLLQSNVFWFSVGLSSSFFFSSIPVTWGTLLSVSVSLA